MAGDGAGQRLCSLWRRSLGSAVGKGAGCVLAAWLRAGGGGGGSGGATSAPVSYLAYEDQLHSRCWYKFCRLDCLSLVNAFKPLATRSKLVKQRLHLRLGWRRGSVGTGLLAGTVQYHSKKLMPVPCRPRCTSSVSQQRSRVVPGGFRGRRDGWADPSPPLPSTNSVRPAACRGLVGLGCTLGNATDEVTQSTYSTGYGAPRGCNETGDDVRWGWPH